MKINFFKKENSFKKKDFIFHPKFYWKIIVTCAIVLVLLSFLCGYSLFRQINQEDILSTTGNNGQSPIINQDRLKGALDYFSAREENSNQILNSPVPVVDPAL